MAVQWKGMVSHRVAFDDFPKTSAEIGFGGGGKDQSEARLQFDKMLQAKLHIFYLPSERYSLLIIIVWPERSPPVSSSRC